MLGTPTGLQTPPLDSSRSALELIYRFLILPADEHANVEGLLDEFATAFSATTAGLATFPEGTQVCIRPTPSRSERSEASPPWHGHPELMERLSQARPALFSELYFSTKPRKRGFALAIAYAFLSAHRGGIELLSRLAGGTIARLLAPVASVAPTSF